MEKNLEKVAQHARDLRQEDPRPAQETLAGFPMAARCLDKCRASLMGWQGDYMYGCPLDQEFLNETGIDKNEFRAFVATGASDREVEDWIKEHSRAHV